MELCQPELSLDAKALNARLTRLEEQLKSGAFVAAQPKRTGPPEDLYDEEERPPMPGDEDAPPGEDMEPPKPVNDAPKGFWSDLCGAVRKELKPPAFGFFASTPNAPVQGVLMGDKLELRCNNTFIAETINKPQILEVVTRKASAMLGKPVRTVVVDLSARPAGNPRMDQLMNFGKAHADIVKIRQ